MLLRGFSKAISETADFLSDRVAEIALFFLTLFIVSCASAPNLNNIPGYEEGSGLLSILPYGAKVYFWTDVAKGRPILDKISPLYFSGNDVSRILDNTNSAVAAIFPEGQSRRFFLGGLIAYTSSKVNFSLSLSKDWKKQKSATGNNYWYSSKENLSLALVSNIALVSDTDPFSYYQNEIPPEGFMEFREGMVMAGWMPNPNEPINGFLEKFGIPLEIPAEDFLFGVTKTEANLWELVFKIKTQSPAQARSLLSVFNMARFFLQKGGSQSANQNGLEENFISPEEAVSLLFARAPEQDGLYLTLRTAPLNESRLALLFTMFKIYSN